MTAPAASSGPLSALLAAFDQQAGWCEQPAPFTARVLRRSRLWLQADAAAHAEFAALAADPLAAAVPLRWVGALHLLALRGLAPWALLWPPAVAASTAKDAQIDAALGLAWHSEQALVRDALSRPPQTNEVQRSAALLPGLLHIAHATRLPLALLEIGSSAGLNLWCDRWALAPAFGAGEPAWTYAQPGAQPDAPLTLRPSWTGPPPPLQAALLVKHRAGCDPDPIDLTQPGQAQRLASFIWPDQTERLARLRTAQAAALRWMLAEPEPVRVRVQALPAAHFVQQELRKARPGMTTVLMHSVVWQYIAADEQQAITAAVQAAAAQAAADAPLAWLRFEPGSVMGDAELRCQIWPAGPAADGDGDGDGDGVGVGEGDGDALLARCHPHGAHIHWLHAA